jgi:hypothetical protein
MTQPLSQDQLTKFSVGSIPQEPTKIRQEALRDDWLGRLREQGSRQCTGLFKKHSVQLYGRYVTVKALHPGRVCALALLGEITEGPRWYSGERIPGVDLISIGAKAGLSETQVQHIVAMNDGGTSDVTGRKLPPHTFGQIADAVEMWFS